MASERSQKRLANLTAFMRALNQLGTGVRGYQQGQYLEAQEKRASERAAQDAKSAPLELEYYQLRNEKARKDLDAPADPPPMGPEWFNEIMGYGKGKIEQSGATDLGGLLQAIATEKGNLQRDIDTRKGDMLDSSVPGLMEALKDLQQKESLLRQVGPQLFQGGGTPTPQPRAPSLPTRQEGIDRARQQGQGRRGGGPQEREPYFQGMMDRGPQAQAHPMADRLPGQMPGEDISTFLANMPGGAQTQADQSLLGEFGRLWQVAMNPQAPEEQQLAAWSRLQQFRVQPPMWVNMRLQGAGGPA